MHIILKESYSTYRNALDIAEFELLDTRRHKLCLKFAKKSSKNLKQKNWFKLNSKVTKTRQEQDKYCPVYANHSRFDKSPISYLTNS